MIRHKHITVTLLCLLLAGMAVAQDKAPQVVKAEPQVEDIYKVLELMDIHIFRFDLKEFLDKTYTVNVYVDECEKGQSPKQLHSINLGKNIESLDKVPEQHRQAFREMKQVAEGKNEWESIKEMSVYLRKTNDSTSIGTINIPGVLTAGRIPFKLRPIEQYHTYHYFTRPFKLQEVKDANHIKVPLILYGSAWLDKKYNMIRFCGEREIDPNMQAEILKDSPHYYIIGVEFKPEN